MYKIFICFAMLFSACETEKKAPVVNTVQDKLALLEMDSKFSDYSEEHGMHMAFLEFMDSNAVLLRPGHLPIVGAHAVDYLIGQDDAAYTLQWKTKDAMVASGGDMGFTYGIWALKPKVQDTVLYGTYVSIWKKGANGKWKFVLDSGNEGIDAPAESL
ncbi:MAG: hypothetical protein ABIT96_02750 [Ferruginibacter sp.]